MGWCILVDLGSILKTFFGTPQYIAQEVVQGAGLDAQDSCYSFKVDCWSKGVILYILVSDTPPFSEDRKCNLKLRNQILQANYYYYPQLLDKVSNEAKDLIDKLLKKDPEERLSSDQILSHPWLHDKNVVARAKQLMLTQSRGRKRLIEDEDET